MAAVQSLFDGMRARDPAAVQALLVDGAEFVAVEVMGIRPVARRTSAASFLKSVGAGDEPWVERMFDPEVDVRGDFAFAKMGYDFHYGEDYSHSGVDQVILARAEGRWRVACVTYSVVRDGASPFGAR